MKLTEILSICINNNLPFYSYRLPESNNIVTGIQLTGHIQAFEGFETQTEGFVVVPFDINSNTESIILKANITFINADIDPHQLEKVCNTFLKNQLTETTSVEISKAVYLEQAKSLIEKLQKQELEKVVLSRAQNNFTIDKNSATSIYEKLLHSYAHAFVSIFNIPNKATWVGATPETLLKMNHGMFETMSLASTKKSDSKAEWTIKENEEQQIVSDFVDEVIEPFPFNKIEKQGPSEMLAGNLVHLMTKFRCYGELSLDERFKLLNMLHPTPAVCGIPKHDAMQMINATEAHDREYYAGYLGPISSEKLDLFVNIRCMKLNTQQATFFIGGGLTAQSKAEDEWTETCLKLETLTKVF